MNKPQIFVDLDGVLADLKGGYKNQFGKEINEDNYEPSEIWDDIRSIDSFYLRLPILDGAFQLWSGIKRYHYSPIVLTGIPKCVPPIPNIIKHKQEWVWMWFGSNTQVICCKSEDKWQYGQPSDLLIDDRLKYAKYWTDMGGIFLHHTSVSNTLRSLSLLYNGR